MCAIHNYTIWTGVDYALSMDSTTVTVFLSVMRVAGPGVLRPCFHAGPQPEAAAFLAAMRYSTEVRGIVGQVG